MGPCGNCGKMGGCRCGAPMTGCGCRVQSNVGRAIGMQIVYCPLHQAAPAMEKAIVFAIPPLESAIKMMLDDGFNNDSVKGKIAALAELRAVLALTHPTGRREG